MLISSSTAFSSLTPSRKAQRLHGTCPLRENACYWISSSKLLWGPQSLFYTRHHEGSLLWMGSLILYHQLQRHMLLLLYKFSRTWLCCVKARVMSDTGPSLAEGGDTASRSERGWLAPRACHLADQNTKSKEKKRQKHGRDGICPSVELCGGLIT